MKKIGVCGRFSENKNILGGQTIKTKIFTDELIRIFGKEEIGIVDTHEWRKNPIKIFFKSLILHKNSQNIIILPGSRGVKVLPITFSFFNVFFKRKIHYVAIGGWLPEYLKKNKRIQKYFRKFAGIYVETRTMKKSLNDMGFENVIYLPNFKRLNVIEKDDLVFSKKPPYKLCTFSRVTKEKGIEDAIEAVISINEKFGTTVYKLDIYGQIDNNYKKIFKDIINKTPDYIEYKGYINFNENEAVLKNYFALLFPTYYIGEGFPGTILDAFSAGLPVIATNWKYNKEIIKNNSDGILYDFKDKNRLKIILEDIYKNPDIINEMKINCIERAKQYLPEVVINKFIKNLV